MTETTAGQRGADKAEARVAQADRLRALSAIWLRQSDSTMFAATIHEFGGEPVEVRLPKSVAVAALEDAIKGLCR